MESLVTTARFHLPTTATAVVLAGCASAEPEWVVLGPRTRALYYLSGRQSLAPRLYVPAGHVRALLGAPVTEVTDAVVPLDALRAAELTRRWEDGRSDLDAGRTERVFRSYLAETTLDAEREARWVRGVAARLIGEAGAAPARIGSVARDLGISERHLRNRFSAAVGVSPKHYARIERVRRVLAKMGTAPWARLATETSFYDQSHLVREFRGLMGVTPGEFAAGRIPTPLPCSPTKMVRRAA
jgi:AraC-like DNA-binding protein